MVRIFSFTISILLCVGLLSQVTMKANTERPNNHLQEYTKYNSTHHDNIDYETDKHSHTHKHSDNSEEHQHDHKHSKVVQNDIKVFLNNELIKIKITEIKIIHNYDEKYLISKAHPFTIFRPPII